MSKPSARQPNITVSGTPTSIPRSALALALVVLGIVWIAVYYTVARDAAIAIGPKKPTDPTHFMADLKRWNYLIGFGLIFLGMILSAHPLTPLGRGRGVVIGMLFCFLFGLVYIVTFYFLGNKVLDVPVMDDLNQLNLLVGVGFMAVGFTFATKWE